MITGRVTDVYEAVIHLVVRGSDGEEREVEAVIDTGFDGWLSLPSGIIVALGLAWRSRGRALLADGSETLVDIYGATVVWDGQARRIAVDARRIPPRWLACLYCTVTS